MSSPPTLSTASGAVPGWSFITSASPAAASHPSVQIPQRPKSSDAAKSRLITGQLRGSRLIAESKAACSLWLSDASLVAIATSMAAVAAHHGRRNRKRCDDSSRDSRVVRLAGSNKLAAMKQSGSLSDEELKEFFDEAGEGRDVVTFKQAISLDGIEGVLEEGGADLDELEVLWGDVDQSLDFENFSGWYLDVLQLYDEFLQEDAVRPPGDALSEEEALDPRNYSDEQLFVDRSSDDDIKGMNTAIPKKNPNMKYGSLTGEIPVYEKSTQLRYSELWDEMERKRRGEAPLEESEPRPQEDEVKPGEPRTNTQVTSLFREACDENNLLSYQGLRSISEIYNYLQEEEITEEELEELWEGLPKKDDQISVLAFRDLLAKIDDLFEFVPEDDDLEDNVNGEALVFSGGGVSEKSLGRLKPQTRTVQQIKEDLFQAISALEARETKPCGLDGREVTDDQIIQLCAELESAWRDFAGEMKLYDTSKLCGPWELIYTTSAKLRRIGSVCDYFDYMKDCQYEALLQNYRDDSDPEKMYKQYDMEEIWIAPDGKERSMRGTGSWNASLQQNVVTGDDDVVIRMDVTGVEYDTADNQIAPISKDLRVTPGLRTFSFQFLGFIDDDLRVMRTGLAGKQVHIFQRMKKSEESKDREKSE
eukprot:TRINITY_DN27371_c0_g1_i1.p1 TRINITY_DN27371_c0_g1~~TRINITY_DN27371_c0_g1_i1.p1  ORF type:complete len:648 (-),score=142.98 TRINITY_DN27371_c0_g1_i1:72-2015(-)